MRSTLCSARAAAFVLVASVDSLRRMYCKPNRQRVQRVAQIVGRDTQDHWAGFIELHCMARD